GKDSKSIMEARAKKVSNLALADMLFVEVMKKLLVTFRLAFGVLNFRDYGRIDMRLNDKDEVYVIEANPNPWLARSQEFAMAAKKSGRNYTELIGEIVELALSRSRS